MRILTSDQLGMEGVNMAYILPFQFDPNMDDQIYLQRTIKLFQEEHCCGRYSRYQPHGVPIANPDKVSILLKYLYEGYDGYYEFEMDLQIIHLQDNDHNQLVLIGTFGHSENGLFDELIQENVLPSWSTNNGLRSVHHT